jgi:hypothetical protein
MKEYENPQMVVLWFLQVQLKSSTLYQYGLIYTLLHKHNHDL